MAQTPLLQIKPTGKREGKWELFELFIAEKCVHKGYIFDKNLNSYCPEFGSFSMEEDVYNLIKAMPVTEYPDHLFLFAYTPYKFLNYTNYRMQMERQGKCLKLGFYMDIKFKDNPAFLWNPILFHNTLKRHLPNNVFRPLSDKETLEDGDGLHFFLRREAELSGTVQTNIEEGIKIIDEAAKRAEAELITMATKAQ